MDKNYCNQRISSYMMWAYFSGFAIKQYKYNFNVVLLNSEKLINTVLTMAYWCLHGY